VPDGATLPHKVEGGRVQVVLPKLDGHAMIAFG
jgi:hypothetical protein